MAGQKYLLDTNHLGLAVTPGSGVVKNKGRVLSQVDMIAGALARQMKLVLLTTGRDIEALPDIDTENWQDPS